MVNRFRNTQTGATLARLMTTRHSKELFTLIRHQSNDSQNVELVDEIMLVRFSSFARGSLFLNRDSVGDLANENIAFGEYIISRDDERIRIQPNIAEINDKYDT